MEALDIIIDGKKYEYVDNLNYNNKNYIAYQDKDNLYINEYIIENGNITINQISDEELSIVKELFNL